MTEKGRRYFSGQTLEQAIMQAARHHGIDPDRVAFRKIEKRHGFLRIRRGIVIEVDPDAPHKTEEELEPIHEEPSGEQREELEPIHEEPSGEQREELEPMHEEPSGEQKVEVELPTEDAQARPAVAEQRTAEAADTRAPEGMSRGEATGELADAARRGVHEILEFAKLDLRAELQQGEGQLEIELTGPDRERLIEDRGNVLLAIQHLLPRLIRGYTGRSIPCRVDSEGFHESRKAELEKLAVEAAQEVRRGHRPRTLPPMNPAERRIIHLTLADDADLVTESQGKGFYKRVTIRPAMRRPRGFDRYSR